MSESLLQKISGSKPVRRLADAYLTRYAFYRIGQIDQLSPVESQARTLRDLVRLAQFTKFGRDHDFSSIRTVADYQRRVPLRSYEQMWSEYWQAVFPRLQGITWPEFIPYYALSSGTTSGATKYLPVSRQMVKSNRNSALTTLAYFLHEHPKAPVFRGRAFFLGGSTDLKQNEDGSLYGDLSGISAREVSSILRPYFFPPPDIGLMGDWEQKVKVLARESAHLPITMLTGVPSWLLTLFDYLKKETGKQHIIDIWPTLQLVVHGGAMFDPYRRVFREVVGSEHVSFQDTYPSSEGYVATEDPRYGLLRLFVDNGIFFEFVPVDELNKDKPTRHTVANLETGAQYAVVLTTCAGLWSFILGDTVRFERRDPPLLKFTGRTKYFLSAFGEHLISEEIEQAVTRAAEATGAMVVDFHVGPIFPTEPNKPGHHRYLIEFSKPPGDLVQFTTKLDEALHELNKDYVAYRVGSISLGPPEVTPVRCGGFADWMRSKGKLGGQHKVPRMDNSGQITAEISNFLSKQTDH
jgi:hypothetical protein